MAQRPTIRDVARAAQTSVGSISNYLNNTKQVSPETRKRIDAAISELGFIPNSAVRVVLGGRSHAIGFLIPDSANPFLSEVARGIEDVAIQARDVVITCNTAGDSDREVHYARALSEMRVTGAIVMATSTTEEHMHTLEVSGAAVVVVGAGSHGSQFHTIETDNVQGGLIATRHLIERGHRRIVFVGGPGADPAVEDRLSGARTAFEEAGLDPDTLLRVDAQGGSLTSRTAAAEAVLALEPRPTAAFCANDLIALALQTVLLRAGVRIPDEFALIGFDDIEQAESALVPLTTVRQPAYEVGKAAAELVLEIAKHRSPRRHATLPVELIVRSTT